MADFAKYYRPTTKLFKSSTFICEPERFLKKGVYSRGKLDVWLYNRIEMAEYFTKHTKLYIFQNTYILLSPYLVVKISEILQT